MLIHAVDSSAALKPVLVDASGRPLASLYKDAFGNVIFSYYAAVCEQQEILSASAGDNWLNFSTVPSGEVWVITIVAGVDITNPPTKIDAFIHDGTYHYALGSQVSPGVGNHAIFYCMAPVPAGSYVRVRVRGCTAGDWLDTSVVGYKMRIA